MMLVAAGSCSSPQDNRETNQDKEREQLLEEKKQRLEGNKSDLNQKSEIIPLVIRFNPFVPPYHDLGEEGIKLIENRLSNIIAQYGVSGNSSDPSFALIPSINILSKNITATAPVVYANTYELTFYTANMLDGTVFSSVSYTLKGAGTTPLKAFINALQSPSFDQNMFGKLLTEGQEKALRYYENNCDKIIAQAKNEASLKNYSSAFLMLKMIPPSVNCYSKSSQLLQEVFQKQMASECNDLLAQMKAELGKQSDIGGFNEKAMSYYSLISANAPCSKEAQQIYNSYIKKLDPKAKLKWTQEEREFNLRKEQQEQNNVYALTKAELEAKVAIDGQTELLDKYKKDAEYDKLPWLRKLVHLGEWDPFDATSKLNSK